MITNYLCELPKAKPGSKIGIYIPFSGGFDSTCLLLDLLKQAKDNSSYYSFNTITTQLYFSGYKIPREEQAREKIKRYINRVFPGVNINYSEIEINKAKNYTLHQYGMILQQIYAFLSTLTIDIISNDKSYLYFSFICGDQICCFENEIKEICYNCLKIQYSKMSMEEIKKKVIIEFPYKINYKEEILEWLITNNREVMDYCTTCDSFDSDEDNCGKCTPCRALKAALINIYVDPQEKEELKEVAYEILKARFAVNWKIDIKYFPAVKTEIIDNTINEVVNLTSGDKESD